MQRNVSILAIGLSTLSPLAANAAVTTVTFQNGANGYTGMVHQTISSSAPDTANTVNTTIGLDGYNASNASPDTQGLLRFDGIFGNTVSQIPAGATVLGASLQLTTQSTTTTPSAVSGGPYGVAGLLTAFNPATSTYNSLAKNLADTPGTGGNVGASYTTGNATRPMAGIGAQTVSVGNVGVNVTPIVRSWAAGQMANNGFAVQAGINGTDDGWIIRSGTHGTQSSHPVLSVSYTTDPTAVTHLQQGVAGYTGTTMAKVQTDMFGDLSTDGQYISQDFIDATDATHGNPSAVLRFDGIDAARPAGATLLSATVVLTTGDSSVDAGSPGTFEIDRLDNAFTVDKPYAEYGAGGPTGTTLSSVTGLISGSRALFDVTAYVQGVLAGDANYGWAVRSAGTTNGWQVNFTGAEDASLRPDLVLVWSTAAVPEPTTLAALGFAGLLTLRRRRTA